MDGEARTRVRCPARRASTAMKCRRVSAPARSAVSICEALPEQGRPWIRSSATFEVQLTDATPVPRLLGRVRVPLARPDLVVSHRSACSSRSSVRSSPPAPARVLEPPSSGSSAQSLVTARSPVWRSRARPGALSRPNCPMNSTPHAFSACALERRPGIRPQSEHAEEAPSEPFGLPTSGKKGATPGRDDPRPGDRAHT